VETVAHEVFDAMSCDAAMWDGMYHSHGSHENSLWQLGSGTKGIDCPMTRYLIDIIRDGKAKRQKSKVRHHWSMECLFKLVLSASFFITLADLYSHLISGCSTKERVIIKSLV
jgi:hypothetical protein